MQQRRLRLGDILDDYCPRERRITNHAVVAMIEDEVKQTRCTTCDAEHEYKQAKVPISRRKKSEHPAAGDLVSAAAALARMSEPAAGDEPLDDLPSDTFAETEGDNPVDGRTDHRMDQREGQIALSASEADISDADADAGAGEGLDGEGLEDDGPVHRRLIRATLPRPEGQAPERKAPDFTMRNSGGRFDQRGGQRQRGRHQPRQAGQSIGQPRQQGAGRQGGQDAGGPRQRNGNRAGNPAGQRNGRPFGANRGSRPGGGQGRKRGR